VTGHLGLPKTRSIHRCIVLRSCETENLKDIAAADGRRVAIEELLAPSDFVVPFQGEVYVGLIWACDDSFDESRRKEVVAKLIQSGCRYVVCGGMRCEAWHDAADLAWAILDVESPLQETPAVMTTWHTDESEEDVIHFAFNLTNFNEHAFEKYFVILIGHDPSRRSRIEKLIEAVLAPA